MAREERRARGSQGRLEGRVRRLAILGCAPHGHGALDAEGGQHQLRQVRSLILALTLGHLEGEGLRLSPLILAPDPAGGRIKVPVAVLQAKPHGSADGTGGKETHGAAVVETLEDAPPGIVSTGRRGERLAQEALRVVVRKELF